MATRGGYAGRPQRGYPKAKFTVFGKRNIQKFASSRSSLT